MWEWLRKWRLAQLKPKMTAALREFNERMQFETSRGTHTQFMDSLSPGEALAYINAFDRWLVGENPQATAEDYYWRSILRSYFFPDSELEKADLERAVALDSGNVDLWVSLGHMAKDHEQWSEATQVAGAHDMVCKSHAAGQGVTARTSPELGRAAQAMVTVGAPYL